MTMAKLSKVLRSSEDSGLHFKCPGCNIYHGIHYGVGNGPRWEWDGNVDKPTFSPSILVQYDSWFPPATPENMNVGPQTPVHIVCHSFVRDGQIQFLGDCTHNLAGQTVDLVELD